MKKPITIALMFFYLVNTVLAYSDLEYFLDRNSGTVLPILLFLAAFFVIFKSLDKTIFSDERNMNLVVSSCIALLAIWGAMREYGNFFLDIYYRLFSSSLTILYIFALAGIGAAFIKFLTGGKRNN